MYFKILIQKKTKNKCCCMSKSTVRPIKTLLQYCNWKKLPKFFTAHLGMLKTITCFICIAFRKKLRKLVYSFAKKSYAMFFCSLLAKKVVLILYCMHNLFYFPKLLLTDSSIPGLHRQWNYFHVRFCCCAAKHLWLWQCLHIHSKSTM